MNKLESKEFKMINATLSCMDDYTQVWSSIIAIEIIVSNAKSNVALIDVLNNKSSNSKTSPITLNKDSIREMGGKKIQIISGMLINLADDTHDIVLNKKSQFKKSEFKQMREDSVKTYMEGILQLAKEHQADLAKYGLQESLMTEVETLVTQYVSLIGQPRSEQIKINTQKKTMNELIDEVVGNFKNKLDLLMTQFSESHPDFYYSYIQARKIVDTASSKRGKDDDNDEVPPTPSL